MGEAITVTIELTRNDEKLATLFTALEVGRDVADILEIDYPRLTYHLYKFPDNKKYKVFKISKPTGGERIISSPISSLKIIQQKLNHILLTVYKSKPQVHSFSRGKSILTNAQAHLRQNNVFNIDLKDFFPSINFGRVRGMFMGKPYFVGEDAATVLAQLCCFANQLPQGAPTSPIVSNMICAKLDSDLSALAETSKCFYTRYADDLTFSTYVRYPPEALWSISASGEVNVGEELKSIIKVNGFEVNEKKIRLRNKYSSQVVTGIKVNRFPNVDRRYVRNIRAMLHAWKKYGLEKAEEAFWLEKDKKHRSKWTENPRFEKVVKGKIEFLGMVKGKEDSVYINYRERLRKLNPDLVNEPPPTVSVRKQDSQAIVLAEGESDLKHLSTALISLQQDDDFPNLKIEFDKLEGSGGDSALLTRVKALKTVPQSIPVIGIFDRDNLKGIKGAYDDQRGYVSWGNNVFTFALPVPSHRKETPNLSIEFYYTDEEVKTVDNDGRRLYVSDEFSGVSGRMLSNSAINCASQHKIRKPHKIIDSGVFNENHENVALPKVQFAENISNGVDDFQDFNFSAFRAIFSVIETILSNH